MNKICSLAMSVSLAGFLLALAGCACWTDAEKAKTPGCVVLHDIVDCTTGSVKDALPYFASIVGGLISGGVDPNNIPWGDIETQAEAMGIKDGGCFLAELKNLIFSKLAATPALMANRKALDDVLSSYKQKVFGSTSVKFKIKDKDGLVVLL